MFKALKKRSVFGTFLLVVVVLALVLSTASLGLAQEGPEPTDGAAAGETYHADTDDKADFDVQAADIIDVSELEAVSIIVTFDAPVSESLLETVSDGQVVHKFSEGFNGASIVLAGDKVDAVASMRGISKVYLDELLQIQTDASPEFIGAPVLWDSLGGQLSAGEGVVIGVIDTGIWPEHPSFADDGSYPAPPASWVGTDCDFGGSNPADAAFSCNNKLIGAKYSNQTYEFFTGLLPTEFDSARDDNGHGTHTASTAGGNANVEATLLGVSRGLVSGIAPRAHIAAYKACGDLGCYTSDLVNAINSAVADGVDVINYSIGGGSQSPYENPTALAFLNAYENGVFVANSAGNSGPGPNTLGSPGNAPWIMTVGASTSNRHFFSTVSLEADNGDTLTLEGASVTAGIATATDVVMAADYGDGLCLSPFAPNTFNGEIVVCERGQIARVSKSFNVAEGGAGGMLLYNPVNQGLATDNHFIPSVHIEGDDGAVLTAFMAGHTGVTGTFTDGIATEVPGDWMASFSSRGGSNNALGIAKPDITAPGVQILAGHTPMAATEAGGVPGELFQSIQGTSMSGPHIAGAGALLVDLHPDWTPGQIKSAIMTTANPNHMKEDGVTPADAFDMGSGRVDLARAGNPGLTISATGQDFLDLQNELWHANYPSLYVPVMPGVITTERTVQSVLDEASAWRAHVDAPDDLIVVVSKYLYVPAGDDATFDIYVDAKDVPEDEVRFATVTYERIGSDMSLSFPITIVRKQPAITLEHSCDPLVFAKRDTTDCEITIQNTTFEEQFGKVYDVLPRQLRLVRSSVEGAYAFGNKALYVEGTLAGAEPPLVDVAVDPMASPFGYVSLAGLGASPNVSHSDESIVNFNIGSFVYAGEVYSTIGMVSNGYAIVGGGTSADVDFVNSDLPSAGTPNNVLAPFWTDLNPSAGGNFYAYYINGGQYFVMEWEDVPNYSDGETNTFQIWIGLDGVNENISFVYGPTISDGDGGALTVGAENVYGNSGGTVYYNGVGDAPAPSYPNGSYEVDVFSVPGAEGESHTISFTAKGVRRGEWQNCAEVTSDVFYGINTVCVNGEVTRP